MVPLEIVGQPLDSDEALLNNVFGWYTLIEIWDWNGLFKAVGYNYENTR